MTLKILLTGKNGQVGYHLIEHLSSLGQVVAVDREQLDLANAVAIREIVRTVRPDVIVNAAAYTAVDNAEKESAIARAVNADAPTLLAEELNKTRGLLIHYSTDYVFDGEKHTPYTENDPTNPLSAYGRTKLAGENGIRNSGVDHLILRTAWVYGARGKNFLLTILRMATQREELRIVNDQFGAPTSSEAIASITAEILRRIIGESNSAPATANCAPELLGTYHVTARGETTWFHFANAILNRAKDVQPGTTWFEAATQGQPLKTRSVLPITTADYPTPARRPAYSVLSNSRLKQSLGIELPGWEAQLEEIFRHRGPRE
ncbi:MAG: dTDP-4-dehydrorhamnose reductase [Candidatus Acidiferrales bacterium]